MAFNGISGKERKIFFFVSVLHQLNLTSKRASGCDNTFGKVGHECACSMANSGPNIDEGQQAADRVTFYPIFHIALAFTV